MKASGDDPLSNLIRALRHLPGVGEKTATRFAFFLLREPPSVANDVAAALADARARIAPCERCGHLTERNPCTICVSPTRDDATLCVVETSQDLLAIERTGAYRGRYHVLHGAIAPVDGVGPEDLTFGALLARVKEGSIREMILATSPSVEGEATALYAERLLAPTGVAISRIASGVPVGASLEYTDPTTLEQSLAARTRRSSDRR
ncbi:MAG: recombination protein RecR [Deltaproteobacteria bacterium]|nr:recombination protein RecR [Deltaproteobacteria bacterium]